MLWVPSTSCTDSPPRSGEDLKLVHRHLPRLELHYFAGPCPGICGFAADLQRDLTDSTVLRNIGVPFAHTIIAFRSIEKGLAKLVINDARIHEDLESNWAVVAEAIQTVLRRENYPNPFEALKKLTRGNQKIDKKAIHHFIDSLKIGEPVRKELKKITPHNYTGVK